MSQNSVTPKHKGVTFGQKRGNYRKHDTSTRRRIRVVPYKRRIANKSEEIAVNENDLNLEEPSQDVEMMITLEDSDNNAPEEKSAAINKEEQIDNNSNLLSRNYYEEVQSNEQLTKDADDINAINQILITEERNSTSSSFVPNKNVFLPLVPSIEAAAIDENKDIETVFPKIEQSFNILQEIRKIQEKTSNTNHQKINSYNDNRCEPIFPGSSVTQETFSHIVTSCLAEGKFVCKKQQRMVHKMLKLILPDSDAKIPIQWTKRGNITDTINDYCEKSYVDHCPVMNFDVCECGETVYVGDHKDDERCEHENTEDGKRCLKLRYNICPRCHTLGKCSHLTSRTAKKVIQYRPLTEIMRELVQFEAFHNCLNFENIDTRDGFLSDVLDGPVPKKHLEEMKVRFKRHKKEAASSANPLNGGRVIKSVNLLLSIGFDGAQIRKSRFCYFYPLLVSIINLPPELRKVNGIGTFVLSMITNREGSKIEEFILRDCLIEELLHLFYGMSVIVGNIEYFIQARLVLHVYDTKAMEKMLKFQSVQSANACALCRKVFGSTRGAKVVVYDGHRYLLSLRHYLRSKGQSQQCCPLGYYNNRCQYVALQPSFPGLLSKEAAKSYESVGISNLSVQAINKNFRTCEQLPLQDEISLKKFLVTGHEQPYDWHHGTAHFTIFRQHLYYQHADYRPFTPYSRLSNENYLKEGTLAEINGTENINGLYGTWPFGALSYSDYETMTCWDPFHCLTNIIGYPVLSLKGNRMVNAAFLRLCKETKCFPSLYTDNTKKSKSSSSSNPASSKPSAVESCKFYSLWCLTERSLSAIDHAMSCILFPRNHLRDNKVQDPIKQFGKLPGVATIKMFTNFMYLIIIVVQSTMSKEYPSAYLAFLAILAEDLRMIQSPSFTNHQIDVLYNRIVELVSLQNGLFTPSEARMVWHQLIDVVQFMKLWGPLRGWWALVAERTISQLKANIPNGGRSYYRTIMARYAPMEFERMKAFYSQPELSFRVAKNEKDNTQELLTRSCTFINLQSKRIQHSENIIRLQRFHPTIKHELSFPERQSLLLVMVTEVLKFFDGDLIRALRDSALVRLYCSCRTQKQRKLLELENASYFFVEWLHVLGKHENREMIRNYLSHAGLLFQCKSVLEVSCEQLIQHFCNDGVLYDCDLMQISKYIKYTESLSPIARTAEIKMQQFSSRGNHCAEYELPCIVHDRYGSDPISKFHRPENSDLRRFLFHKDHYSSWFQFCNRRLNFDDDEAALSSMKDIDDCCFGQFNFFARINCPLEPILHHLPIGCATTRKLKWVPIKFSGQTENYTTNMAVLDPDQPSILKHNQSSCPIMFVALSDVFSNPIAIIPSSSLYVPISETEVYQHIYKLQSGGSSLQAPIIKNILFVGLSPERNVLKYHPRFVKMYNDVLKDHHNGRASTEPESEDSFSEIASDDDSDGQLSDDYLDYNNYDDENSSKNSFNSENNTFTELNYYDDDEEEVYL